MSEDDLPPDFVDELLTREEASAYLATIGVRRRPATLAKLFCMRSDGPPCIHDGRKPFYPKKQLHAWGVRQLTAPRQSSSERRISQGDGEKRLSRVTPRDNDQLR